MPATLTNAGDAAASATLHGLMSGTVYHFRLLASSVGGSVSGADMTFTTSGFASLSGIALSRGTPFPAFASANTGYFATVPYATSNVTLTAVAGVATATLRVNGSSVDSGTPGNPIELAVGANRIDIVVTAADGDPVHFMSALDGRCRNGNTHLSRM
jgi:hypothetical protein